MKTSKIEKLNKAIQRVNAQIDDYIKNFGYETKGIQVLITTLNRLTSIYNATIDSAVVIEIPTKKLNTKALAIVAEYFNKAALTNKEAKTLLRENNVAVFYEGTLEKVY